MARSVETIKKAMMADMAADTVLSGSLTSPSGTAIWRLMIYIFAVLVNLFEQALDLYNMNNASSPRTKNQFNTKWLRNKVFEFQYGDYLQLDTSTFEIKYPSVTPANKIIAYCAVFNKFAMNSNFGGAAAIYIRVCKSGPTLLNGGEISALTDYVSQIIQPGTQFVVESHDPDYVFVRAVVKYDPRYQSSIQADIFAAMTAYVSDLEDGLFTVDNLFQFMNDVQGVKEVVMEEVAVRVSGGGGSTIFSTFPGTNTPILNGGQRYYAYAGGVMLEENTPGSTWADTVTFIPIA